MNCGYREELGVYQEIKINNKINNNHFQNKMLQLKTPKELEW